MKNISFWKTSEQNQMFLLIDNNVQIGDLVTVFGKNMPKSEFLLHNNMSNYESFLLIR